MQGESSFSGGSACPLQASDLYDWIALLRAACGEAPGKDWPANVTYGRALRSLSDYNYLFWTRVSCYRLSKERVPMVPSFRLRVCPTFPSLVTNNSQPGIPGVNVSVPVQSESNV